jgi:hypothetical protein
MAVAEVVEVVEVEMALPLESRLVSLAARLPASRDHACEEWERPD